MVGSVIPDTLLASQIIIQMSILGYAPSMWTKTYTKAESQMSWEILLISFVPYPKHKETRVLLTSFTMEESAHTSLTGSGANTQGLTNTLSTCMSALRKRLTMIVLFFRYLC
jgi:hypothetical protein